MLKRLYLDHASCTPIRPEARAAMEPWLDGAWNPSALHYEGRCARAAVDRARSQLAAIWGVRPRAVCFTASGSESVALALGGAAQAAHVPGVVWSSPAEHAAVLGAVALLEAQGWQVRWLRLDGAGRPDLAMLEAELAAAPPGPRLVSLMLVNNELGTISAIAEAARIAHRYQALIHCDAIAAGEVVALGEALASLDFLSLAAQKCGGPLGVGVLIVKERTALQARTPGGPQEDGLRAGTENVAAIVGATAAFVARESELVRNFNHALELQQTLEQQLGASFGPTELRIGARDALRAPSISHLSFAGLDGPTLLAALDLEGISASAGSACAAGALERSHVLAAIGYDAQWSGVIRLSWGPTTPKADIEDAALRIEALVKRLREVQASQR